MAVIVPAHLAARFAGLYSRRKADYVLRSARVWGALGYRVEVPLAIGTYEWSGVVKNEDGTLSRGYKLATLRTLLDSAGLLTPVALSAIQVHDMAVCRPLLAEAPVWHAGDLLLEDRGFLDGATVSHLK